MPDRLPVRADQVDLLRRHTMPLKESEDTLRKDLGQVAVERGDLDNAAFAGIAASQDSRTHGRLVGECLAAKNLGGHRARLAADVTDCDIDAVGGCAGYQPCDDHGDWPFLTLHCVIPHRGFSRRVIGCPKRLRSPFIALGFVGAQVITT